MTKEEALNIWLPIISTGIENMPELKEAFDMAVESLKEKWTPISEGLPEKENDKEDRYLTTILNEYDNSLRYVMTCDFINGCWCPDDECASNNVIAWMPLPEPYKAEGSEK